MFDIVRALLYIAEWVMCIIVWGGTSDRLESAGFCYFGKQSMCGAIIFFGVISWLALTAVIIARLLDRFTTKFDFSALLELRVYYALLCTWGLLALLVAIGNPDTLRNSTGDAVVGFAWVNFITHAISTALAFIEQRHETAEDE